MPAPEVATFAPNAVTISAINNEGVTRLLEVVKINKNNKQTAENVNNPDDALSAPTPSKGKNCAFKKSDQLTLNTGCFWRRLEF